MWWSLRLKGRHFRERSERERFWDAMALDAWILVVAVVPVLAGFTEAIDRAILTLP